MKKLTAGILTVMLGLVVADANAAITSQAYVDGKFDAVSGDVTTLSGRVDTAEGKISTLETFQSGINNTIVTTITTELTKENGAFTKALADKADASVVTELDNRVTAAEGDIDALEAKVGETSVAAQITAATAGLETQEHASATYATKTALEAEADARNAAIDSKIGTLPEGAANVGAGLKALQGEISAIQSDENGILKNAKDYTDGKIDTVNGTIGTVEAGSTVVGMIEGVETAYQAADTELNETVQAVKRTADAAIKNLSKTGETGKFVLTAVVEGDQTTYAWEAIERAEGENLH